MTPPIRTRHTHTMEYIAFSVLLVSSMQLQAVPLLVCSRFPSESSREKDSDPFPVGEPSGADTPLVASEKRRV